MMAFSKLQHFSKSVLLGLTGFTEFAGFNGYFGWTSQGEWSAMVWAFFEKG